MNSNVLEAGAGANAAPRVLEVRQVRARLFADNDPRVVVRTGKGRQHAHRDGRKRHHARTGLAVAKPQFGCLQVDVLPA